MFDVLVLDESADHGVGSERNEWNICEGVEPVQWCSYERGGRRKIPINVRWLKGRCEEKDYKILVTSGSQFTVTLHITYIHTPARNE